MKRIVFLLFLFFLISCGNKSPVGTWKQKAIVANGITIPTKDYTLTFHEDGTFDMWRISRLGYCDSTIGTWKYDSERAIITLTRKNGFVETWTNVRIGAELRVTGKDFDVIFIKKL